MYRCCIPNRKCFRSSTFDTFHIININGKHFHSWCYLVSICLNFDAEMNKNGKHTLLNSYEQISIMNKDHTVRDSRRDWNTWTKFKANIQQWKISSKNTFHFRNESGITRRRAKNEKKNGKYERENSPRRDEEKFIWYLMEITLKMKWNYNNNIISLRMMGIFEAAK